MGKITRNKAAEILGVSSQTVSNYFKQGLIGGCVGKRGLLYINSDDVDKYAQKYKMIAANEKMINEKLKEVEYRKRAINVELTELRNRATANGKLATNAVGMLFGVINAIQYLNITPKLSYRELQILKDVINGMTYNELSVKYGLTASRIGQITKKMCNRLAYYENAAIAEIATNEDLKREIERQNKEIKSLQASLDDYRQKRDKAKNPPAILSKNIDECGLSNRIQNIFKMYNMYTIGDLVRKFSGKYDLYRIRNIGGKSICAILDFIEENNLSFKQNEESEEDFYIRLNNKLSNQKD